MVSRTPANKFVDRFITVPVALLPQAVSPVYKGFPVPEGRKRNHADIAEPSYS
jgi:hypothetical protein